MRGFKRFVKTFATALIGQFCREIGLKASGETIVSFFGYEYDVSLVYSFRVGSAILEVTEKVKDMRLQQMPKLPVEEWTKSVWTGACCWVHVKESVFNFLLREGGV